jgi:hypothetical protein
MTQSGTGPQAPPTRKFELGDIATNRILFALALLGVLLPANSLVGHYNGLNFLYNWPHASGVFKGPYQIHASAAYYLMEGFLAVAVYFYSFNFIFRIKTFQVLGIIAYACSLSMPLFYLYLWIYQKIGNAINGFSEPLFGLIDVVCAIPFIALFATIPLVFKRLQD